MPQIQGAKVKLPRRGKTVNHCQCRPEDRVAEGRYGILGFSFQMEKSCLVGAIIPGVPIRKRMSLRGGLRFD
jgi:hypothetical protein